jgi:hypothetical protein
MNQMNPEIYSKLLYELEFAPFSEYNMPYENALLYCQFCSYNGHTDWRMPTADEWHNNPTIWGWYTDRPQYHEYTTWSVRPVRNLISVDN